MEKEEDIMEGADHSQGANRSEGADHSQGDKHSQQVKCLLHNIFSLPITCYSVTIT